MDALRAIMRERGIAVVQQPSKLLSRVRLPALAPLPGLAALGALGALAMLAGCTPSMGVRASKPITITKVQYQPLPAYLLTPCTIQHPPLTTWGSAISAANTLYTALTACAAQVDAIRTTTGSKP